MKKFIVNVLPLFLILLILFAFKMQNDGAIQGKVLPPEGAQMVVAIAGRDTIAAQVNSGSFMLAKLKPGTYTVWLKGVAPFRDTSIVNVAVIEGTTTDVGEIRLGQSLRN
ncbi:MAG: hypothetical protein JWQ28_2319 [Pedobacter sp.]|jgi:hypothetical protein|nr:hypothetical protein [Pedobacter sp.]